MGNFTISPEAREDLDQIHAYISEHNADAADRILEAALATFTDLARMPGMGQPRTFHHSELSNLRSFRVAGFRNYLIFYRAMVGGVEIVRLLHGARNLDALFGDD
jgi:toxin ParE1/3/4